MRDFVERIMMAATADLMVGCAVVVAAGVHQTFFREKPKPFTAEGNDVTLIAVTDEGTRVYRVFGPKMLYATVVVVGPDGRASIRQ